MMVPVLCRVMILALTRLHISMLSMIMVCELFVVYSVIGYLPYCVKISTFIDFFMFIQIET